MMSKPTFTFAEFQRRNPGTKHTKETYCAAQFKRDEVKDCHCITPGQTFRADNYTWRITLTTPLWVWAVPARYPENYWD